MEKGRMIPWIMLVSFLFLSSGEAASPKMKIRWPSPMHRPMPPATDQNRERRVQGQDCERGIAYPSEQTLPFCWSDLRCRARAKEVLHGAEYHLLEGWTGDQRRT